MAAADTALEQTPPSSAPPPSEENLSLSDHEAKYSGQGQLDTQAEAETKPVETPAAEPEPDSGTPETDERDEQGRGLARKRQRAGRHEYPDLAAVAIESDTLIPSGSLIDAWILQHKTGPDILYYLQTHPTEIQAMLQLPVLEQAESLALLAQRFNGHGRAATAATGSAPASLRSPPPRPRNPVRTGPSRSGGEPPDPDKAGVFDHERYWPQSHRSARV